MIRSFRDRRTERFHRGDFVPEFESIARPATRRLRVLEAAESLQALAGLPSNRLEALRGNRRGQHSIRINRQWRICFVWRDNEVHNVEIVDYH